MTCDACWSPRSRMWLVNLQLQGERQIPANQPLFAHQPALVALVARSFSFSLRTMIVVVNNRRTIIKWKREDQEKSNKDLVEVSDLLPWWCCCLLFVVCCLLVTGLMWWLFKWGKERFSLTGARTANVLSARVALLFAVCHFLESTELMPTKLVAGGCCACVRVYVCV